VPRELNPGALARAVLPGRVAVPTPGGDHGTRETGRRPDSM